MTRHRPTLGELDRLFQVCAVNRPPAGAARDAALLAVLYGAGLRRAEAVALDLADYDSQCGTLKVLGKGNKERLAHVGAGGRAALDEWIQLRGTEPGPLFWPVHRSGRIGPPRRLSARVCCT
ncbi:MAG: tyrosine-type recombinase/integrase [Chloroflexi bacterium]|nr:tyrosine-type recombinase/integrase [Chloroflexota bacterium]